MPNKNKPNAENSKQAGESWRKPLRVPPRTDAMRSFYQGEELAPQPVAAASTPVSAEKEVPPPNYESPENFKMPSEDESAPDITKLAAREMSVANESKTVGGDENAGNSGSNAEQSNKLTEEDLSRQLGFEIDDLYDVHELLRGKSFDIYQTLMQSRDDRGRCKITQPELMKSTGIKNRRTFYKHEGWLINLKLLEKRHLPGDHKGVVYRVFEMADVLPVPNEMLNQFAARLEDSQ